MNHPASQGHPEPQKHHEPQEATTPNPTHTEPAANASSDPTTIPTVLVLRNIKPLDWLFVGIGFVIAALACALTIFLNFSRSEAIRDIDELLLGEPSPSIPSRNPSTLSRNT